MFVRNIEVTEGESSESKDGKSIFSSNNASRDSLKGEKKHSSPPPYTESRSNGYSNQLNDEEDSTSYQIDDDKANVVMDVTRRSPKLSAMTKLAYASVGLPYSMQLSIIAFYINYFLLDVAKVRCPDFHLRSSERIFRSRPITMRLFCSLAV